MHLALIDWFIIAAYLLLSLAIGLWYKDKAGKSMVDFFLGGRNLTWYIAGMSMVATTFAADTPLAVAELVGQYGISGNWLWWNMLLGGMLTTFFFAKLWRRAEVLTEVELIELRYGGKPAAFLRGFKSLYLGLFMNTLIIGWVNVALVSLLKIFFNIPDDQLLWYAAGAMLITAVYSAISGLWGVAITDVVQFIIAMAGCIVLAVLVVSSGQIGGIEGLKEKVPFWALSFFPTIGHNSLASTATAFSIGIGSFFAYIGIQWWASWYPGAEPGGGGYVAQRMMSTKNEKHAIYATLFFQIMHYCIRPWPWILVGLCSLVLYPDLGYADKKLGYVMVMKDFLPAGLKGLLLVAFLAAYMSTVSTQLNWGASYVVNDFYHRFLNRGASQKTLIAASRYVTLGLMLLALLSTSLIKSISGMWSFIIECGAGLGLVLILRWYWWRINAWSEIAATIAPFIAFAGAKFIFNLTFPASFFLTVGFTTLSWIVITLITPPEKKAILERFYLKVKPGGWWKSVASGAGVSPVPTHAGGLFFCWLSAIVLTYSALFFTGYLLFHEWQAAGITFFLGFAALLSLRYFINKSMVFEGV